MKRTNQKIKTFSDLLLDEDEKLIEQALERDEFESDSNIQDTKKMLEEAASRHLQLNASKPVTIRINQLALIKLKAKAKSKNIPYQTLLGILINEYLEGETKLSL